METFRGSTPGPGPQSGLSGASLRVLGAAGRVSVTSSLGRRYIRGLGFGKGGFSSEDLYRGTFELKYFIFSFETENSTPESSQ